MINLFDFIIRSTIKLSEIRLQESNEEEVRKGKETNIN